MDQPKKEKEQFPLRTIILYALLLPIVFYLFQFAYRKNTESASRAQQCQEECMAQGYDGHEFKWDILSGPKCQCLRAGETY